MVKDGKGGYKALKGSVTAEDVRNAIETDESGNKSVVITAAFHSEIVDKDDLTNKTPSGEYPKYAVILRANGGTFAEDGSDHLYIKPQSMEFSAVSTYIYPFSFATSFAIVLFPRRQFSIPDRPVFYPLSAVTVPSIF